MPFGYNLAVKLKTSTLQSNFAMLNLSRSHLCVESNQVGSLGRFDWRRHLPVLQLSKRKMGMSVNRENNFKFPSVTLRIYILF